MTNPDNTYIVMTLITALMTQHFCMSDLPKRFSFQFHYAAFPSGFYLSPNKYVFPYSLHKRMIVSHTTYMIFISISEKVENTF